MLQEIIDLQNDAVTSIISELGTKNDIIFKSPTGSGKTYMMADLMDRILVKEKDVVFIVSSLSKGGLAEQNYDKFEEYVTNKIFKHINPYMISSETSDESGLFIPTNYNVYVLPRDLYKDKSKLKSGGAFINFLDIITKSAPLGKGKKIYLIKDECHIVTNNLDGLKEQYFTKILFCSATPKLAKAQKPDVQIKEEDAVATHLIKKVEYGNETDSLDTALFKFKEIKEKYLELSNDKKFGGLVNPCLIIQISNKDKADYEIEEIRQLLGQVKYQDLQWMLIVDKDKDCDTNTVLKKAPVSKWKEDAKKPESTIDIIIFKMVITEGWDIPRACMLYQIRDSQSKQLDEQVIGRVRRNPKLLQFEKLTPEQQELVTTAYVWGVVDEGKKETRAIKVVDETKIKEEFKLKTTRLKRPVETTTFDIHTLLKGKTMPLTPQSIFDLYEKYSKIPPEVKDLGDTYIANIPTWFTFANNIDEIVKVSKNITCDYNKNMEIVTDENGNEIEVSIPILSYYTDNENYKNIGNWLWQRVDNEEEFSFDSQAEQEWCEILLNLANEDAPNGKGRIIKHIEELVEEETKRYYLIGKNYLPNSEIKFEYYLYGIHSSYPDFIMKDYQNRIHLFESKSLNISNSSVIDNEEYKEKVKALQDCYKTASRLTGYYFYLPIKKDSNWTIWQYENGNEHQLSKKDFITFMKK